MPISTINTNSIADDAVTVPKVTDQVLTHRNLIINGAMQVAQRGTSGTSTADIYTMDRFALGHGSPVNAMTFEQSTDAPNNFKNSLKITAGTGASASTTGYAILRQAIEGQNISHLGFGTSAAKALTLSFWVKSSLTGTFGVSVRNQAGTRAYGGTYSISSANTWEYITVAIPADTSGTWPTDNGIGFNLFWDLGAGSNYDIAAGSWTTGSNMFGVASTVKLTETTGATFYITGAQLELGDTATPFEHRSYAEELSLCQRYYFSGDLQMVGNCDSGGTPHFSVQTPQMMRTLPTLISSSVQFRGALLATGTGISLTSTVPPRLSFTATNSGSGNTVLTSFGGSMSVQIDSEL